LSACYRYAAPTQSYVLGHIGTRSGAALVQTSGNSVRQAKAIVVAIAKNVAAEVQATARIFVALAFKRASGVKLGKEIAAAIAKSAEDNGALSNV
jgi:hypothetical protein